MDAKGVEGEGGSKQGWRDISHNIWLTPDQFFLGYEQSLSDVLLKWGYRALSGSGFVEEKNFRVKFFPGFCLIEIEDDSSKQCATG